MKVRKGVLSILFSALLIVPAPAGALEDLFTVGGVHLFLGMSLQEAQQRFASGPYKLQPLEGASGAYSIVPKEGPPFESPGSLTFRSEKLWWVGKNWGNYFGPDTRTFFESFFSIFSKIDKEAIEATVVPVVVREPNLIRHEILIKLPDRRSISISVTDMKGVAPNVSIQETLGGR